MDVEKNIADIAFLEELYALPDERPILTSEEAASPKHDELQQEPVAESWAQFVESLAAVMDWVAQQTAVILGVPSRKQCLPHECTHDQTPY